MIDWGLIFLGLAMFVVTGILFIIAVGALYVIVRHNNKKGKKKGQRRQKK
jgi:heme/copper-type cytochrome/quinol oxidase subunit 2